MTDPARGPTTEELRARALAPPAEPTPTPTPDARAALRALVAVVEDVAWNGYAWIGLEPCVSCSFERPHHSPDCELEAALSRAEAALDSEGAERPQTTTERSAPMRYCVNATLTVPAYIYVEADSSEAALEAARDYRAQDFESDMGGAEVEFNVTPSAELVNA